MFEVGIFATELVVEKVVQLFAHGVDGGLRNQDGGGAIDVIIKVVIEKDAEAGS